jgi:hypothetical protein
MWTRKTSKELIGDRRARRVVAGLCAVTALFLAGVSGIPHPGFHVPAWVRMSGVLAAGFVLLAWRRRAHHHSLRSGVMVCEKCNIVTVNPLQRECVCGGMLAPLTQMKWLEAPPSAARRDDIVPAREVCETAQSS